MSNSLQRVSVQSRHLPNVCRILSLFNALWSKSLVSQVSLLRLVIKRNAHIIEIEIVFFSLCKPSDFFMAICKEPMCAHAVLVIPDYQVCQEHTGLFTHERKNIKQVSRTSFALVLQAPENCDTT